MEKSLHITTRKNETARSVTLKSIRQTILAMVPVVFASLYPIVFLLATNWYEVSKTESGMIAAAQVAIGLFIFACCYLISRRRAFSSVFATAFMMIFLNFNIIYDIAKIIAPSWKYGLSLIMYLVLLCAVVFVLIRFRKRHELYAFQSILTIVMLGLILYNCATIFSVAGIFNSDKTQSDELVASNSKSIQTFAAESVIQDPLAVAKLVNDMTFDFEKYNGMHSPKTTPRLVSKEEREALEIEGEVRPNFYWLILDEACDFHTMQKFYDYDCAEMNDFLLENKFNISYSTINRSSISNQVMADLCTLEYTATATMTPRELKYYAAEGQLWSALQDLGYDLYKVCSDPYEFFCLKEISRYQPREVLFRNATMVGLTQLDLTINSTPLRVLTGGISKYTLDTRRIQLQRVWDFYANNANYTFGTSVALVSHIMAPHTPFVYAADGSNAEHEGATDWEDPQYYLEQYKYTMSQARVLISNLIQNDPNCIIMLMSDHGARPRADDRHRIGIPMKDEDMIRTLNAVYLGGKKIDIEGKTLVNTLRLVLTELGGDFPQLTESPQLIPNRYLLREDKGAD